MTLKLNTLKKINNLIIYPKVTLYLNDHQSIKTNRKDYQQQTRKLEIKAMPMEIQDQLISLIDSWTNNSRRISKLIIQKQEMNQKLTQIMMIWLLHSQNKNKTNFKNLKSLNSNYSRTMSKKHRQLSNSKNKRLKLIVDYRAYQKQTQLKSNNSNWNSNKHKNKNKSEIVKSL